MSKELDLINVFCGTWGVSLEDIVVTRANGALIIFWTYEGRGYMSCDRLTRNCIFTNGWTILDMEHHSQKISDEYEADAGPMKWSMEEFIVHVNACESATQLYNNIMTNINKPQMGWQDKVMENSREVKPEYVIETKTSFSVNGVEFGTLESANDYILRRKLYILLAKDVSAGSADYVVVSTIIKHRHELLDLLK